MTTEAEHIKSFEEFKESYEQEIIATYLEYLVDEMGIENVPEWYINAKYEHYLDKMRW